MTQPLSASALATKQPMKWGVISDVILYPDGLTRRRDLTVFSQLYGVIL